jgi:hypothetical protein
MGLPLAGKQLLLISVRNQSITARKKGRMSKKPVAPRKKSVADKKPSTQSRTKSGRSKPSSQAAEFDVREFPSEELIERSHANDQGGPKTGDRNPETEEFSAEIARLQAHVFAKKYRKRAQGFLWNRAKLLNVGDFIKIAGFEREFTKQTGSKGPREVRVVWTKAE